MILFIFLIIKLEGKNRRGLGPFALAARSLILLIQEFRKK
jgi:hypothetical protein